MTCPQTFLSDIQDIRYHFLTEHSLDQGQRVTISTSKSTRPHRPFCGSLQIPNLVHRFSKKRTFLTMTSPTGASIQVSILTPIYNAEKTLESCFQALAKTQKDLSCEVILVNDGSTDSSEALMAQFQRQYPTKVITVNKSNGGEASALNLGWSRAQGDFVAILEADVEPDVDWLQRCLSFLQKNPEIMAVGGVLTAPKDDPWIARFHGYDVEAKLLSEGGSVRHLTSANVLYRREAFEIAGPFDETLINASLDAVFNDRLINAGHRLHLLPEARVIHRYKRSLAGYLKRHFAYARYRVYGPRLNLYPADRWLSLQVALTVLSFGLFIASGVLKYLGFTSPYGNPVGLAVLALTFALAALLPVTIQRWITHRDSALVLYPGVAYLRNLVGAVGYGIGLVAKTFTPK